MGVSMRGCHGCSTGGSAALKKLKSHTSKPDTDKPARCFRTQSSVPRAFSGCDLALQPCIRINTPARSCTHVFIHSTHRSAIVCIDPPGGAMDWHTRLNDRVPAHRTPSTRAYRTPSTRAYRTPSMMMQVGACQCRSRRDSLPSSSLPSIGH